MFQFFKSWLKEFATAQPASFDTSPSTDTVPSRDEARESWARARQDYVVVVDVRPQLDACAAKVSTFGRCIRTRYNEAEKCAELFAPDGAVLAKVRAFHGDMVFDRAFIKTEDAHLQQMIVQAIAVAHPRVEISTDTWPAR